MVWQKIPINTPFWSNAEDESRAAVIAEERRDVMKDALGTTIRRPGLSVFNNDLAQFVDGMQYWLNKDLVYVVSGGNLYNLDKTGTLTLVGSSLFVSGVTINHVTWAQSADLTLITADAVRKLFASNGGRIVEYDGDAIIRKLVSPNAPTQATHIIMFDNYLMGNDLSDPKWDESIQRSNAGDPITWEGNYFSAENHPDKLLAIHTAWDEIALFGEESIQNNYNDKVEPFSQIPGGNVDDGTLSPWTIKKIGSSWMLLNTARSVIRIDGRQSTDISDAIDDLIDGDVDYANAEGEVFLSKKKKLYLLTINDRTFVYDYKINEWVSEWGFWDKANARYTKFKARNFVNVKPWGMTLCTDKDNGNIYKLDFDVYQDNGNEIRSNIMTGQVDHGTGIEKRSNELKIRAKRGKKVKTTDADVEPKMLVRFRDNGSKVWSNYIDVLLGFEGDNNFYFSLFQLGSYESRQYEFICTDNVPWSIAKIEEDVEFLR